MLKLDKFWFEGMAESALVAEHQKFCSEDLNVPIRKSYLAGRISLHRLLKRHNIHAAVHTKHPEGSLYLKEIGDGGGSVGKYVNLTHSKQLVISAVCSSPVGVDTERVDRSANKVIERVASEKEREWIEGGEFLALGTPISRALVIWCVKEAAFKAIGIGWQAGVDGVSTSLSDSVLWNVQFDSSRNHLRPQLEAMGVRLFLVEGHLVTVCAKKDLLSSSPLSWFQ